MMRARRRDWIAVAIGIALIGATSSCAAVKPWERDTLARTDMRWDPDPLAAALQNHIRFSKEGSLPPAGGGGGGCGCN